MPEMFLHLYHGRNAPEELLEDWGFDGPHIGPLELFHTTYRDSCVIGFVDMKTTLKFLPYPQMGIIHPLNIVEDCIEWKGKFYGDWTAYITPGGRYEPKT